MLKKILSLGDIIILKILKWLNYSQKMITKVIFNTNYSFIQSVDGLSFRSNARIILTRDMFH